MIKPKFNKKLPKNWGAFLSPASDEEFKKEHPRAYTVLVILGITAIMLPIAVYLYLAINVFMMDSMLIVPGFFGAMTFGAGLFNIVAAFIQQYLGHRFTIITLAAGLIICALSIILR